MSTVNQQPAVPDLAVVIVSWNTANLLRTCLRSLFASSANIRLQVIVVDNASQDGSSAMLRSEFPQVKRIENAVNIGYSKANNQGITASQAGYVMLLNSDTEVPPGALDALLNFMAAHPQAGACGPTLVRPNGSPQPYGFGRDPTLPYLLARGLKQALFRRNLHDWATTLAQPVDWVSGACLLTRRAAIQQAGLLDENLFMYFEDNDWCLRLRQAGWTIYLYPQVTVVHLGGQSVAQNPAARNAYRQSLRYFYRKHYARPAQWLLRLLLPLYERLAA